MLKFSGNGVGKRVLSAFLCAVLSFSNVQIAYAGESTEEILREGAFFASESNPQQEGIEEEASKGTEAELAEKEDREEISKESPSNLRDKTKENTETENAEAENGDDKGGHCSSRKIWREHLPRGDLYETAPCGGGRNAFRHEGKSLK